jgi:glycosyltransferase involved in cell wall biosynthesis
LLLLTFYYPPDLCAGSFRAEALVRALRDVGGDKLQIDLITTMPNRYHSHINQANSHEAAAGTSIYRIPLPPHRSGMLDQSKAFASFARSALRMTRGGSWDVVMATSSRLMTAALGAWIARRAGVSLYLDIRDLFTDTMSDLLAGRISKVLLPGFRALEHWTLNNAARVNLVSAGFLPDARRISPQHDYRIFTNGIDDAFLSQDFSTGVRDAGHIPLIVYAGNMGDGQGLHNVIPEAARMLDGKARFRLIGDGGRRKQLEDALARLGTANVEILDPVPRTELFRHYREADVLFLHLNDHAAFQKVLPSKIFEYAATGKPILAGVSGHAADFLEKEVTGVRIFSPCDATGLVDALDRLMQQSETVVNRSSFKRKYARERIMWDMARDILALGGNC